MSHFVNAKDAVVVEAIDGVLRSAQGRLARLDGYPHIKVVVRQDWDRSKVAVISGGGSGHEPAHAGFVGKGMLTAAVCGDIFASPSVDAVLAAILTVTGKQGCLLIVKNYTGDRLNFGLAAERARTFGLAVNMVIVDDDIALPDLPQARGIAGTLLVHKVAGAAAEAGKDLATVTESAQAVIDQVVSLGMSLDTCSIPGVGKELRILEGNAEVGLGIHGEAGAEQMSFEGAHQAVSTIVARLAPYVGSGPLIALVNNLGGTTQLEMSILVEELAKSELASQVQWLVGPAPLMTSLDMRGFSVSLLPANEMFLDDLRAPSEPLAWPGLRRLGPVETLPLPDGLTPIRPLPSHSPEQRSLLEDCCDILIAAEAELNALDAKSGDGDTGSTLARAAEALKGALDGLPLADTTQLLRAIGIELSQTMGGSSGVLLAIFFAAAGDASAGGLDWVDSLVAGLARVEQVGGASLGDRTMLDALAPALGHIRDGLPAAAVAARAGADYTATIGKAKAGRASYITEDKILGHNDPGAEAVAIIFERLAARGESRP